MLTTTYDGGRDKRRKVSEPESGGFGLWMSELPGLNDLGAGREVDVGDGQWILDCNPFDLRKQQQPEKVCGFECSPASWFSFERMGGVIWFVDPVPAGSTEVRAGRMSDEQIPMLGQKHPDITLEMLARPFGRKEIAGPGVPTKVFKRLPDSSAEFAGNKDPHWLEKPLTRPFPAQGAALWLMGSVQFEPAAD